MKISKPENISHSAYYYSYIEAVKSDCAIQALENVYEETINYANTLSIGNLPFAYAPNKWTIAQVLKHICDAERVYAYRLLRFARKDTTPLSGFEENDYALSAPIYNSVDEFIEEYQMVRRASISLINQLTPENIDFEGKANGLQLTPRIIVWLMAGHNQHHIHVLKERYG